MTDRHTQVSRDFSDTHGIPPEANEDIQAADVSTERKRSHSMVREIIETLLLALLIFVAVRAVVLNFRVDGHSMDSSLADNEMLLVNRNAYFSLDQDQWLGWIPGTDFDDDEWRPFGIPERGDIIVLNPPNQASADKPYIKRAIGLPGDTFEIRDGGVFINGIRLVEPYLEDETQTICQASSDYCGPLEIPEDSVLVLGDNRDNSEDSRIFGFVPIDNIIGKAWITYWPTDHIGVLPHHDYPELDDPSSPGAWRVAGAVGA